MADKISHLNNAGFLKSEHKKRTELSLPNGAGTIVSYHPFESMQILFFDLLAAQSKIPKIVPKKKLARVRSRVILRPSRKKR